MLDIDDDDDDDDDNPYDEYAKPDQEVVKQKALKRQKMKQEERESENRKLLEDALGDLSDEDSPTSMHDHKTSSSEGEEESATKASKIWPPSQEPMESPFTQKQVSEGGGKDVLKRWPPASSKPSEVASTKKPRMKLATEWIPKAKADGKEVEQHDVPPDVSKFSAPLPPSEEPKTFTQPARVPSPDTKEVLPVHAGKPMQIVSSTTLQQEDSELSKVKLKKPSQTEVCL